MTNPGLLIALASVAAGAPALGGLASFAGQAVNPLSGATLVPLGAVVASAVALLAISFKAGQLFRQLQVDREAAKLDRGAIQALKTELRTRAQELETRVAKLERTPDP